MFSGLPEYKLASQRKLTNLFLSFSKKTSKPFSEGYIAEGKGVFSWLFHSLWDREGLDLLHFQTVLYLCFLFLVLAAFLPFPTF